MLTFWSKQSHKFCDGISRRGFLKVGGLALGGLTLADVLRLRADGKAASGRGKSVIMVYLNGGASQLDMFDPKPKAPAEFRGEFKAIPTNVSGIQVGEMLPKLAQMADKYSIVNGMQVITSGHSLYEASTGFSGGVRPARPAFTSVVSKFTPHRDREMPASVAMAYDAGPAFLGAGHAAFQPSGGLMNDLRAGKGIPQDQTALLRSLDKLERNLNGDGELAATDTFTRKALEMLASPKIRDAFDMTKETESAKEKYGKQTYGGTSLLLALRLAAAGVSAISVYGPGNNRWDTHKDNFKILRDSVLPEYDRALSSMISDLYERGLDKHVLIAVYGEFGRTPRVNKDAGRDHYPQSGFVQLAGGGLKMGQVIGDTGSRGDWDISRSKPYTIQNLLATLYRQLEIDPEIKVPDNFGRPQYLLEEREPIAELL